MVFVFYHRGRDVFSQREKSVAETVSGSSVGERVCRGAPLWPPVKRERGEGRMVFAFYHRGEEVFFREE